MKKMILPLIVSLASSTLFAEAPTAVTWSSIYTCDTDTNAKVLINFEYNSATGYKFREVSLANKDFLGSAKMVAAQYRGIAIVEIANYRGKTLRLNLRSSSGKTDEASYQLAGFVSRNMHCDLQSKTSLPYDGGGIY